MIEILELRITPATFIVTTLADAGAGSLRDAIDAANDAPGADIITFQKGLTGVISVASGQMDITDTLTIKGPGSDKLALDAAFTSRFFSVGDGDPSKDSALSLSGLAFYRGDRTTQNQLGPGGAIVSTESLKIKNCAFGNNRADSGGGAIRILEVASSVPLNVDIRDSAFFGNSTTNFGGGAIAASVAGSVTLKNNSFTNNRAILIHGGGAIQIDAGSGKQLLVEKCQFIGNVGPENGAADLSGRAGANGPTKVIVRDCVFAGNTALVQSGGALSIFQGEILFERNLVSQNIAGNKGGGLVVNDFPSLVIRSSQFLGNTAKGLGVEEGGGGLDINIREGSSATIIGSIISGNRAITGAGILVENDPGTLKIIGTTIANNVSPLDGAGVRILADPSTQASASVELVKSKITANISENLGGGLMAAGTGKITLKSCQVTRNRAAIGGGLELGGTTPVTISGGLIAHNFADFSGGGIHAGSALELRSTKIVANSSSANGGGIGSTNQLTLKNCIVSGNASTLGGGIHHVSSNPLTLSGTKVFGNFSIDLAQVVDP